jgi:methionine-rich copper-binding protein CopC
MKIVFRLSAVVVAAVLAGCPTSPPTTDTTPPTVSRTVPDRDALGVATNAKLTIDFSESMDMSSMSSTNIQLSKGTTSVSGTVSYDDSMHEAQLVPGAPLDENAEYTATVTTGVKDLAGNALASAWTWKFTTVGNAPHVVSTTPADGMTGVAQDIVIKFVFDKSMNASSLSSNMTLTDATQAMVPASVSYDDATFTASLTPSAPLAKGKMYAATAKAGILGTNGLALPADKVVAFTILNTAPSVTSTTPADQAMNVALDTPISAHFSDAIAASSLTATSFFLKEGTNMLSAAVMLDAARTTATLMPTRPLLEGRTYSVTLTTDIQDDFGNPMASAKVWTFETLTTIPTVTSVTPADMTVGIGGNAAVQLTFSEAMDPLTVTDPMNVAITAGASAIPGTRLYDAATRSVTFQPTGAYPGGQVITVTVTPGAKDPSGFGLASSFTSAFTVSNAPSVTASMPQPNDVNVPLGASVSLTFGTAMDTSTLAFANVWVEDAMMNKVPGSYTAASTSLIISPSAPLAELKTYSVVVTPAVQSSTHVPFAAQYRFSFTTSPVPPVVVSTTPSNGASDISVTAPITIVFDKDMDVTTFTNMTARLNDGANDIAGTVTAMDARTLVLTPSAPLHEQRKYTATVNGVADVATAPIASPYIFSFTTEALPRLTGITPPNGSSGVPTNAHVGVSFNKDITSTIAVTPVGAGSTSALTLINAAGARVDGAVVYSSSSFSADIRPQMGGSDISWAPNSRYTVIIDGTKLLDSHGNAVGGSVIFSFATGAAADSTAPAYVTSNPLNGATGVQRGAALWAQLSEQLNPSSVNATTVQVLNGATPLPGAASYDAATQRVIFTPSPQLPAAAMLTFQIGAVKDLAGNAKAAPNAIAFTTADNAAPSIAGSAPANNASNVAINTKVRLAFSEPINPASLNVTADDGSPLAGTTAYDDATASALFTPAANLPGNTTVNISVAAGLMDLEGKATAMPLTISFQTVANSAQDVTAPTVMSSSPANNATGVPATQVISVQFSEAMLPSTVTAANVALKRHSDGSGVWAALAFDASSDRLTLTPGDRLKGGVQYDVVLGSGLTDLAGNALTATTLTFTVENVKPTVQSTQPMAGSTVGSGVQIQLGFSEALDPSSINPSTVQVNNGGAVLGAVSYDPSSHSAVFQPSKPFADGTVTVTLSAAAITDLAGNALTANMGMSYAFTFTVSSAGPSVTGATPCGMQVDADDFGTQVVTINFDRNVQKAGGGNLDGTALKLQLGGTDQAVTVMQTAGTAVATLTPSSALQAGMTYTVLANSSVVASNNNAPMASTYTCTFTTQKVVFQDGVNDTSVTGYTLTPSGGNVWQRINSGDDTRSSIVWRGGNSSDGQNYVRDCKGFLGGNPSDYTVVLEKQVDLTGLSSAEVRFQVMDDIQRSGVDDQGRFIVNDGTDHIITTYTGQNAANPYVRQGKGSGNLNAYVNKTVKIRWELLIRGVSLGLGQSCTNNNTPGAKGLFVDDLLVVGQ